MRKIRASELGNFLYCQRSWWFDLQGEKSENQAEMDLGTQVHQLHAKAVKQGALLKGLAIALFLLGVLLFFWSLL
mgnify:CR=1 FL=1